MDRTLVIIKPDGLVRKLVGEIISRFEKRDFRLVDCKLINANFETVESHYEEHKSRGYFDELVSYIMEGPIFVMVIEGNKVIETVRTMIGNKDPVIAQPGTIRGDFANSITRNIIHASDSPASAEREIGIWFK